MRELCDGPRVKDAGHSPAPVWNVRFRDGSEQRSAEGPPRFTFCVPSRGFLRWLFATDVYSAGVAFVRGEFDVDGDLEAAIRLKGWYPGSRFRRRLFRTLARGLSIVQKTFQAKNERKREIGFHYDLSNQFYRLFLDPRLVYSCAYFRSAGMTLEQAQLAKLNHICRKLDLQPGEQFLDIGCGWGGLVEQAIVEYGADATGCTLSHAQHAYAAGRIGGGARIRECDFRDMHGRYDKIASVGMFEHVGLRRAPQYFRKMAELLAPNGLFLNHAIARAEGVDLDAASLFVGRYIFPGGQLIRLHETIRAAEECGFEVLDVENLRPHYALTCRMWGQRLLANREAALRLVSEPVYRAWRIWLAGSALNFEQGLSSIYQVLMSKRGAPRRRITRDALYRDAAGQSAEEVTVGQTSDLTPADRT